MAGSVSEDFVVAGGGSSAVDGLSDMQHCHSVESLVEWRSCDQVENGTPSTSPPYWDTDEDDDVGPKPSDLYGKFTWKIDNFSQISKRELRSNAFEVGGYKWYILIYPQGCDVCNHLSLFLCVANHDKLLPGWSHFAQFTIAVVNKDPKKHKYSDTLHRFWKKEHDWGWKKFMELTKMSDGFVDDDILTIKAQVQLIREKAHRPFRCLDCQYRRELIRVYVSSVEQTCRRYVEERRDKLSKLVEDKVKWSSFHAFWLGIDKNVRRGMSRDKIGSILKLVVKHFFIEKEVISTLVMDSLYSGLRALECQSKKNKARENIHEEEELPSPMVGIEEDMFVLADDVFLLLERAISETLPHQPVPLKDDKYSHNRAKEGTSGDEFTRDSIVRDERRLTELGRRTLEIFVLSHIFSSRIEVAYQEAVALKRQEELIREEEEAGQAENELKAKRRALEKEKRAKKKQAKQRRRNGKGKDRGKDEKLDGVTNGNDQQRDSLDGRDLDNSSPKEAEKLHNNDIRGDVSDVSEPGDDGSEVLQPDEEDRCSSPHSWETDTLEIHPTKAHISEMEKEHVEKKNTLSVDDSSSTCSTDSVPSVVLNGPCQGNSSSNNKINGTSNRGKKQRNKDRKTCSIVDAGQIIHATGICGGTEPESDDKLHSLKDRVLSLEQHQDQKVEVAVSLEKKSIDRDELIVLTPPEPRTIESSSSTNSPSIKPLSFKQLRKTNSTTAIELPVSTCKQTSNTPAQTVQSAPLLTRLSQTTPVLKSEFPKPATEPITTRDHQTSSISRPSSAPLISGPRPAASHAPTKQALPPLSCTLNSVCHLVTDPSPSDQCYEPPSYRNAIMGIKIAKGTSSSGFTPRPSLTPSSQSIKLSQPLSSFSSSSSTQTPVMDVRKELSVDSGFSSDLRNPASFCSYHEAVHSQHVINRSDTRTAGRNIQSHPSQGTMPDEFPHLDIINDLLDEEQIAGRTNGYHHRHDHHPLDRWYTIPGDSATASSSFRNGPFSYDLFEPCYDAISQMVCDSSGVPYHLLGDPMPWSVDFLAYGSSQMGALLQNQWPVGSADMSMVSFAGNAMNADEYAYHYPDFSTCLGGYNMMYQPANGL